MVRALSLLATLGTLSCLCLLTQPVAASETAGTTEHVAGSRLTTVLEVGLGGGNVGVAARAGLHTAYWTSWHWGVGLGTVALAEAELFGDSASAAMIGPVLAYRSDPTTNGWLLTAAPALAYGDRGHVSSAPSEHLRRGYGYAFDGAAHYYYRPGIFVLGTGLGLDFVHPVARLSGSDRLPPVIFSATIDLLIGAAF